VRSYAPAHPSFRSPRNYGSSYGTPVRKGPPLWMLVAGAVVICLFLGWFGWRKASLSTRLEGFQSGVQLRPDNATGLEVRIHVKPASATKTAELRLDDAPITDAAIGDGVVTWRLPADLTAGEHRLALTVDRPLLTGRITRSWTFTIDGLTPSLQLNPLDLVAIDKPVTVEGTVEAGAVVTANDQPVNVVDDQFSVTFPFPPAGPVLIVATDAAGNQSSIETQIALIQPPTHAVHVRSEDWANPDIRNQVYGLIDAGKIDAVELDIKDENGIIGYDSTVQMARDIGATQPHYELKAALDDLHGRGVRVIGRIVAFRDPILANAAWNQGYTDAVLQDPEGGMLDAYGGFTNYVNQTVRDYNMAIAIEAAEAGFDDVLWDYLRRPEGEPASMFVPGLGEGKSADYIVSFLAEAHARLRPLGVRQGASLFGIAATRPGTIAQDVTAMAHHLDYVAPMLYPSHWNGGEYGIDDPNADPYAIIKASLADFQDKTQGLPVTLCPWLQDFDDGLEYGVDQINAQTTASRELGVDCFLMWNPSSIYTADALQPLAGS